MSLRKVSYMEILKKFFKCYFHQAVYFDELDGIIHDFKGHPSELQLITELHRIIQTNNYTLAAKIIKKYGGRTLDLEKTKKLINFLYDQFIGKPTDVKPEDFKKKVKIVFCPFCCPDPEKTKMIILIEKATVIGKDMQVYICKTCKHVWLTEDIRIDNAKDYKAFMKSIGLKGLWKELSDVDIL